MKKRLFSALMAVVLTASLVACGGGKAGSSSSSSSSSAETSTESESESEVSIEESEGGDETLSVWCWDPNFNIYAMKEAEKIYQKDHPNFKLDIQENVYGDIEQKLITAAESGDYSTLPDIFLMQDYSFKKMVANYPGIYTTLQDAGVDVSQFSGGKLADSTVDGVNYGIPFDNGASIMALRIDLLEEAGFSLDDFKDLSWSQFNEKAKVVMDKTGLPMLSVSGGSEIVIEMLQSAGANLMDADKVNLVGNEALMKALETYKEIIEAGILDDITDWDGYIASMNDTKCVGVIQGCWIMASIQAAEDQSGKWGIVNMPKLDGIDGATNYANCGGSSWAISSNCQNLELAADFMNSTFGGSVELYDTILPGAGAVSSYLPASESSVYQAESEFYAGQKVYADIVEFAGKVPALNSGAYYSDFRSALTDACTNIIQNKADIAAEVEAAQKAVEFAIQ